MPCTLNPLVLGPFGPYPFITFGTWASSPLALAHLDPFALGHLALDSGLLALALLTLLADGT